MNTLVMEQTEHGEFPVDVYTKLSNDRILFITDTINDRLSSEIVATLLLKDAEDPNLKITIFINSEGADDLRAAFSIYDVVKMISAPVETVCIGTASNEAALILACGTHGMRHITKNSLLSLSHLVNNHMGYVDLTEAKQSMELSANDNKKFMQAIADCCGKTLKQVTTDFQREVFMNAGDAIRYGLADSLVKSGK